jgi:predicted secreted acid phosphatase
MDRTAAAFAACCTFALVAGCATAPSASQPEPVAAGQACAFGELLDYHDNAYLPGVQQVTELARRYLEEELAKGDAARPAMTVDIDETALSNWGHLSVDLCGPVSAFDEYAALGEDAALGPVLDLFRWARERGVAVFFVTGRREWLREATERNLREAGYDGWAELFMRPVEQQGSWNNFKAEVRERLHEEGFEVLVNLGDQLADLEGGYARHALLVPNPFYVISARDFRED